MIHRTYKKDGRTLAFEHYGLSEVSKNKKALFRLEKFMQELTFKNMGTFAGSGFLLAVIFNLATGISLSSGVLFAGIAVGLFGIFPALAILSTIPYDKMVKNHIRADRNKTIIQSLENNTLTVDEVFEFYDSNLNVLEVSRKIEHAKKLLGKTSSDSPVYEDLETKKALLDDRLSHADERVKNAVNQIEEKAKADQKTEEEKEVLEFLNAA